MSLASIILAGGKGNRLQSIAKDKILLPLGEHAVICWSVGACYYSKLFETLLIVYRDKSQKKQIQEQLEHSFGRSILKTILWTVGGIRRQDSVLNALESLPKTTETVFVHDGARPFVTATDLNQLKKAFESSDTSTLATPVTDTIKRAEQVGGHWDNLNLEDLDRNRLFAMQTPQVFNHEQLLKAYRHLNATNEDVTDCVEAHRRYFQSNCRIVFPEQNNLKITRPEDVEFANFLIQKGSIKNVIEFGKQ